MLDVKQIKKDFPIFTNLPELVYLDSTATSLKPQSVLNAINDYYTRYTSNIHRGIYKISEKATDEYEETRSVIAQFIHALSQEEVIFTRSTTESINLVAYSLGRKILNKGDEVVITIMEHHSNFVPWQQLAFEIGADLKIIDIDESGELRFEIGKSGLNLQGTITKKTKILALTYVSNVLGTINPLKEIIRAARRINPKIVVVIDAAQAAPHLSIDVTDLDCDFLAFSSHKMCGPTGMGVLWGRMELLRDMFPFNYGGDMIEEVYIDKTMFREPPYKFEAGTPHIAGVIGLKAAIRYLQSIGLSEIHDYEQGLVRYAMDSLKKTFSDALDILGPANPQDRVGVIAFTLKGCHPHDVAHILDEKNIAIRVGFHCAMPLHERLNVPASSRASFYLYTTQEDIDVFVQELQHVYSLLT
ncbi:cysteine desulfurase [Candidatus Roizmanbacteria bacterium RIFCSPLOWO2_02_FULL_37_19]|uniref:Cysteine desulfurase n=1 Tax=Candidatus Roizmanbacteria bacterium RIFCSPHIGHO2_02_FULL_37_24 TaxID=1802037 RepID=A0A1F7GY75_9BACT|nr:MAG: cysteine desulfurase [Candidatus Roizmanbacteria bacterium RIFCSPHIGHO2_01_FULL_38_41]OGK23516.1 MAG: cysteine desulfurase [Candidatus Roizmanbacteria bacterium RIFCSPHIGHO2_02_FULL_37_24]OGK45406.1 MAG: cysteine desulfurase [Candidatus Roizmanbacteria bacterium RIFCSPLOWO2_01_FULL_37_57]OGK54052.1 MAG: cysteine desulfurase [Candidatus Roizmanbacteria bacterium RIFCSPLOWO2_02_FULL_37_19]OGK60158.1 MAG: cysteine desulfurase [Candidatus Roizmanbacteria bacterium RIFCSPLOWO2_12_FULL_37_7b]